MKNLKVIKPFSVLEVGDTLTLSADGKSFETEYNETFEWPGIDCLDMSSTFAGKFSISIDYAKTLIEQGFLADYDSAKKDGFVNIFDAIDELLEKYTADLDEVKHLDADVPACLKVEKETVLTNLITVLNHLKNLKK